MKTAKTCGAIFALLAILVYSTSAMAQVRTDHIVIHSDAIEGNLQGNSADRDVYVVLPASYGSHPARRYPVIYYLHGFGDTAKIYVDYINPEAALAQGDVSKDFIIVFPDGSSKLGGSMYADSPAVGDYEAFIAHEVVDTIDGKYRTIARADGRGLAGHSMGAAGALRIGMKHPEIFSAIYASSACCLSLKNAVDLRITRAAQPEDADKPNIYYAMMAAFAPNPSRPPIYADLLTGGGVSQDMAAQRVAANGPTVLVPQYASALRHMKGIVIDVGDQDGLRADNELLDAEMTRFAISHQFMVYAGDHGNQVPARFASEVLPFFASTLSRAQ